MQPFGFTVPANGYDHEDRVTAWNRQDGNKNQTWGLSLVGDWNTHTDAGVTQTRTHGPAHEFTSVTVGGNNHALSYDSKGNMLTRPAALSAPALNLVWDFDNQLKGADIDGTPASLEVTFEFDALGRRVARNEGSSQVVFVQAGQQVVADYARFTPSSTPTYRYVYASYIDEPILRHSGTLGTLPTIGTDAIYYHRNEQFSIIALTSTEGGLIERIAYSAYGLPAICDASGQLRSISNHENRLLFSARDWDKELTVVFVRKRFFSALIGRFESRGFGFGKSVYGISQGLLRVHPLGFINSRGGDGEINDFPSADKLCNEWRLKLFPPPSKVQFNNGSVSNCNARIKSILSSLNSKLVTDSEIRLANAMSMFNCSCGPPIVRCECCNDFGGMFRQMEVTWVKYPQCNGITPRYTITLCTERVKNVTDREMANILLHEIIHNLQFCDTGHDVYYVSNCLSALQFEMEAYFCGGSCIDGPGCMYRALRSACRGGCGKNGALTEEIYLSALQWFEARLRSGAICKYRPEIPAPDCPVK